MGNNNESGVVSVRMRLFLMFVRLTEGSWSGGGVMSKIVGAISSIAASASNDITDNLLTLRLRGGVNVMRGALPYPMAHISNG